MSGNDYKNFEQDSLDIATLDTLEHGLKRISDTTFNINLTSSLLNKLKLDPSGNFNVSKFSKFRDNHWTMLRSDTLSPVNIRFNSKILGSNDLKKQMTYHFIPDFDPFCTIRSYTSTRTYADSHRYMEIHLLEPNHLDCSPESIRLITLDLLDGALDRARDVGGNRAYAFLLFYLISWISLSDEKLIDEKYRLCIPLKNVNTNDRRADVQNVIKEERIGWKPFSEIEMGKMIKYALFWTEKAIPVIKEIKEYAVANGYGQGKSVTYLGKRDDQFETLLTSKRNGIEIVGCNINARSNSSRRTGKEKIYGYDYSWVNQYTRAVDRVRNGLFILFGLLVGLRSKEMGHVKFEDVYIDPLGEWHLNITRFKTSNDPNFFGDKDTIPLPSLIGELVMEYKELRDFRGYMRKGYLFQPLTSARELNYVDAMIAGAAQAIGKDVGIEKLDIHRFRKTIAEILINRSERNIDIIRMLFGHKSYKMTLRYIARNPYLVESVVECLETHFTADFVEIVSAVASGHYSGLPAERIAMLISQRPESFKGKLLRLSISSYVTHLLESGAPLIIQRTNLDTFCLSCESYTSGNLPPCLAKRTVLPEIIVPDHNNCQLDCKNVIVTERSKDALKGNIDFYQSLLKSKIVKATTVNQIRNKISISEKHLASLSIYKTIIASVNEVRHS